LLRQLVTRASNDRSDDRQIGRTLFRLLIPLEMERFSAARPTCNSKSTAALPAFRGTARQRTPGGGDSRPWAIRAKLLRKLRTADFRGEVADAGADASALVIGEPACDPAYPVCLAPAMRARR